MIKQWHKQNSKEIKDIDLLDKGMRIGLAIGRNLDRDKLDEILRK